MHRNEDFIGVIGHISVYFATLDLFVSLVLAELAPPRAGRPVVALSERATLGHKLKALQKLKATDISNAAVLADIQAVLPRAVAAAEERNRYLHDQWVFSPELIAQGRIQRIRFTFPLKAGAREELTISDLLAFKLQVGELQKEFARFYRALRPEALTHPET